MKNYYCSQKFWWLTVDIEKRTKYSCCEADPVKIDIDALKNNADTLFNCDQLQQERRMMLNNQRVRSCETACWSLQDQGQMNRRAVLNSDKVTHINIESRPEYLNVMFGSDCNMTCVYCCKNYSTAWRRDILNNGDYSVPGESTDRFRATTQDRVLNQISRPEIQTLSSVDTVMNAIRQNTDQVTTLAISGGEPFLSNSLVELIDMVNSSTQVIIFTGLGVNPGRMRRMLESLSHVKNLSIEVSAENTGEHYEFVRYGNSWANFNENLKLLENFNVKFRSTISNITAINFDKFYQQFSGYPIDIQFCFTPNYLSPEVLDPVTKNRLIDQLGQHQNIVNNLSTESSEQQRIACRDYLTEFSQRRNLSLDIFPGDFVKWLNQ